MIKTFNLWIFMKDRTVEYTGISRTALKYFIEYHQEDDNFYGYDYEGR